MRYRLNFLFLQQNVQLKTIKMKPLYLVLLIIFFAFQSCDKTDFTNKEYVEKQLSLNLCGDNEKISPWTTMVAYTGNGSTLYVKQGKDTKVCKDGTFEISKGHCSTSDTITLYLKTRNPDWIHIGITYRKRMKSPSISDDLTIKIKGYVDNIQHIDTTHTIHAFYVDDKITESDYIFKLHF